MADVTNRDTITQVTNKYFRVNSHSAFRRLLESQYGVGFRKPVSGSPLSYPAFVKIKESYAIGGAGGGGGGDVLSIYFQKMAYSAKTISVEKMRAKLKARGIPQSRIDELLAGM